ncbi:MAG: VWA domain-containing protein [Verrucomicrobiaceae bacterium]|nr:VWA domain-containing protein [Verrucomicrobiaceae bacterium]
MTRTCAVFLCLILHCLAAEDEAALLKDIAKNMREGRQEALAGLKDLHSEKAADFVLSVVSSNRVGGGMKARLAEIVAAWPATAPGRKTLFDWLVKHPNCGDDELLFYTGIHLPGARSFFWAQIEQAKGEVSKIKNPQRVAMAIQGLGFFEDNPDVVVERIGALLHVDSPHVIRACAADSLGGMKHPKAVDALIPHVEDEAVGARAVRSLYRLTGQHFDADPARQWAAWRAANAAIGFKMHTTADFDNFLKLQALLKPADDAAMNMSTFYGIDVRGKGILFILDVSGSMTIDDRISKLRAQMGNILIILESRPEKLRYGILTFGDRIDSCFPRGIADNKGENRRKAQRFVDDLRADGGTPMVEALTHAMKKVLPDANLDTIFFLSDGQPSDGTPEMVLDLTRQIHQRFQVRFNTISIGEDAPQAFGEQTLLQQMAALTGGIFTQPK